MKQSKKIMLLSWAGGTIDPLLDSFSDSKAAGAVIGSTSPSGALRGGTDSEGVLSIDHGKLRMPPMVTNGWNREGPSYPAQARAVGLAVVVRIIDGDVQANLNSISQHLAVGWFSSATPASALTDGNAIVFTENSTNAGKLERNGVSQMTVITPFKQTEAYIVVVLRATGAAYYVGSVSGAIDLPDYPNLRLVGVDTVTSAATVYPGIWQRAMTSGANYTRAFAIQVKQIASWANWYGSAHAADTLTSGTGSISGRTADGLGGTWTVQSGTVSVTNGSGASGTAATNNYATLDPGATSGYIKMVVVCGASTPDVKLLFRWSDSQNFFDFQADGSAVRLEKRVANVYTAISQTGAIHLTANHTYVMEVLDNGTHITCYLSDLTAGTQQQAPSTAVTTDTALASNTKVGVGQSQNTANTFISNFEAHPRTIALPAALDLGAPYETLGTTTVYTELFGTDGNLAGQTSTTGSGLWAATLNNGTITNAGGVGVATSITNNTLDTLPWSSTAFADLSVDVLPPGASYGLGQASRAGVVFWQDASNWLGVRVFVDDSQTNNGEFEVVLNYAGSINVIRRVAYSTTINHGVTTTLRATFDGDNFIVFRGTEAAVCYAITDSSSTNSALTINRVGLYVGAGDTGSTFDNFAAKSA